MYANYTGKQTLNFYDTFQNTCQNTYTGDGCTKNSRNNQDTELAYGNKTLPEHNKVQFKMLHYEIMRMGRFWIAAQNS